MGDQNDDRRRENHALSLATWKMLSHAAELIANTPAYFAVEEASPVSVRTFIA